MAQHPQPDDGKYSTVGVRRQLKPAHPEHQGRRCRVGPEPITTVLDCGWPLTAYGRYPEESKLEVPLCHFTEFALVGDTNRIYLPLVLRNH